MHIAGRGKLDKHYDGLRKVVQKHREVRICSSSREKVDINSLSPRELGTRMGDMRVSENYRHCRGLPNMNGRLFVLLERPISKDTLREWTTMNGIYRT